MTGIFLKLLNMSIAAGWLVIAIALMRPFLKKTPRWVSCLLWGIVGLRLVVPFFVESTFSLIPSAEVVPQDIATTQTPAIHSGIPVVNSAVNPLFTQTPVQQENVLPEILSVAAVVWLIGVGVLLIYSIVMYGKLRRQMRASVLLRDNIYVCDEVPGPFILGVIFPKIYIPSGMEETCLAYVLAHEKAHIQRKDHWWKPVGFVLLTVYWFHPLLWVAYILLCRDIEQACDEKVISSMDTAGKKGYSEALVACSMHRRMVMACPVAFGEVGVKARIKGIVNYKKPGFWILIISVLVCMITAVCFLTNPKSCDHAYESKVLKEPTCIQQGVMEYTCSQCRHMYTAHIDMQEHSFDQPVVTLAPTCTNKGSAQQTCADCGLVKTVEMATVAHTAGEPFFVKESNCTQQGERTATCTHCAAVFLVETLAVNDVHDLKETVLKEPTCTATGEGVLRCTLCDHTENCTIERLPHSYQVVQIIKATCLQQGEIVKKCTHCDDMRLEITAECSSHNWKNLESYGEKCIYCGWFISGTSVNK